MRWCRGPSSPLACCFALVFKFIPMVKGIRLSFFDVRPFLGDIVGRPRQLRPRPRPTTASTDALGTPCSSASARPSAPSSVGLRPGPPARGPGPPSGFVRTAVFLPVVTATAVVGEMWRHHLLPHLRRPDQHASSASSASGRSQFLDDPDTALLVVDGRGHLERAPYNMVIILAGLAGVDRTLYEAAAMDGASLWQRLRYVTLPALRPAIAHRPDARRHPRPAQSSPRCTS